MTSTSISSLTSCSDLAMSMPIVADLVLLGRQAGDLVSPLAAAALTVRSASAAGLSRTCCNRLRRARPAAGRAWNGIDFIGSLRWTAACAAQMGMKRTQDQPGGQDRHQFDIEDSALAFGQDAIAGRCPWRQSQTWPGSRKRYLEPTGIRPTPLVQPNHLAEAEFGRLAAIVGTGRTRSQSKGAVGSRTGLSASAAGPSPGVTPCTAIPKA